MEEPAEKERLLAEYKASCGQKDCKRYYRGAGQCYLGNQCFYRHVDSEGRAVDLGPPYLPRPRAREEFESFDWDSFDSDSDSLYSDSDSFDSDSDSFDSDSDSLDSESDNLDSNGYVEVLEYLEPFDFGNGLVPVMRLTRRFVPAYHPSQLTINPSLPSILQSYQS